MTIINDKQIITGALASNIPFWVTWGQKATIDTLTSQPFKLIMLENDGDLVVEGPYGANIFVPAAKSGDWIPVVGIKILSSGIVEGGGSKTTTASGFWVYGGM